MNRNGIEALAKYRQQLKENGGDIPIVRRNPVEKLLDKPTSRTAAIEAMCYTCFGEASKKEISKCTSYDCPLYIFRPGAIDEDIVVWKNTLTKRYCDKGEI